MGPFQDRDSALSVWREVAEQSRSDFHARYTIAQETGQRAL
jgi:hypothetical protein